MVHQLVAGRFDYKAEMLALRDVCPLFRPALSPLTVSVLTNYLHGLYQHQEYTNLVHASDERYET